MSRSHLGLVVVMVILLSSFFALTGLPTANAELLGESFTGEPTGTTLPTGWTEEDGCGGGGDATINDTVFDPTTPSMNIYCAASGGRYGAFSPLISVTGGFTLAFRVNITNFIASGATYNHLLGGLRQGPTGLSSSVNIGVSITAFGDVYVVRSGGCAVDTGVDIVEGTWYEFRFIVTGLAGTYSVTLDGTTITSGCWVGLISSPVDIRFQAGGETEPPFEAAAFFVDWISLDAPTVTAITDDTVCRNVAYSQQAASDAADEETWSISGEPAGITISSSGLISGTPTDTGTSTITVTSANSAGSGSINYDLTVNSCGGGGFHKIIMGGGVWEHADYEIEDKPCVIGDLELTFMDKSVDPRTVLIYIWDFGEGGRPITTSSPNVTHTFAKPGIYTVTLAIMLSDGTAFRQTQEVDVGVCASLISETILNLLAALAATAVILWLVFVFTRRKPIMIAALIATLVAVSGWTLLVGF